MNEKEINGQYKYILQLINQKRLKEALTQLDSFLYNSTVYDLRLQLEQVQTSYQYMLNYLKDGIEDSERIKLYNKLLCQAIAIADQARLYMLDDISTQLYHSMRRKNVHTSTPYIMGNLITQLESFHDDLSIGSLFSREKKEEILKNHEEVLRQLFMDVWTNAAWSTEQQSKASYLLESDLIPANAKCIFTSGVTLSVINCFDINKVNWLFEAYQNKDELVAQRALIGLVFIFHLYANRIQFYPEMATRFEVVAGVKPLKDDLSRIYKQILMCQETDKIDRKMREEIIPEMIKNVPKMDQLRFDMDEDESSEGNPDWENLLDKPGIGDKLREMNELQMEGADVQMSTFSSLKGFSFFREIHHWFYIFDKLQPDVEKILAQEESESKMFNLILETGVFCNSDKYSLLFIMQQLPASQRKAVFSQLTEQQLEQFMDSSEATSFKKLSEQPQVISNQYLQDLYRFFRLSYYRTEFTSMFKETFDLQNLPVLKDYLKNEETLLGLVDFYIKNEHWSKAADICREIIGLSGLKSSQADLYQKQGYAYQKMGNIDKALDAYIKADTIQPDSLWTNRHIATCYRLKRDYKNAYEWYNKVLESTPDNHQIIYFTGSCLAELGQYEEAMKYFFKLDYLKNDSVKAWRGLVWCSFVTGKLEQGMKYCKKIFEGNPTATDFLNAGHIACCSKSYEEAASYYRKAIEMLKDKEQFLQLFENDKKYLIKQGVAEDDLPLIIDLI